MDDKKNMEVGDEDVTNSIGNVEPAVVETVNELGMAALSSTPDKEPHRRQKIRSSVDDDSLKPTRISERLSIKRNRLEDVDDECSGPCQTQTPPRKGKTSQVPADKQQKKDISVDKQPQKKDVASDKQSQKKDVAIDKQPQKRDFHRWDPWQKNLFFKGLEQFGKDFDAISKKVSTDKKSLILGSKKNKSQVRMLYNRLWRGKIVKLIDFSEMGAVHPVTQELYGLINYGVLRRYMSDDRIEFQKCLNQLIQTGKTSLYRTMTSTRKLVTVKTPKCPYLKKINKIEDTKKSSEIDTASTFPTPVTLELTPKNSSAWAKVQELSQNPRIRLKLSANRSLESVFRYLGTKWKSNRIKLKEALGGGKEEAMDELMFTLHPSCKIMPVTFFPQEPPKEDVNLNSYMENILPFLKKKKQPKVKIEPADKNEDGTVESGPEQSGQGGSKKSGEKESASCESISSNSASHSLASHSGNDNDNNCDKNVVGISEAMECQQSEDKPNEDAVPLPLKSPSTELASGVPAIPEDENAIIMDLSKFPHQSSKPEDNQKDLSSSVSSFSVSSKSSLSEKDQPALELKAPSSPALSLSPSSSSSTTASSNVISPSLPKKKQTKSTKKKGTASSDSNQAALQNTCDSNPASNSNTNHSSARTLKLQAAAETTKKIKEESERELNRLTSLAGAGFTLSNANHVTLLHLSVLLGRETVIKMEYEFREIPKPNSQVLPAFCRATSQMANVLRRLCNIAQLELTSFQQDAKTSDPSKTHGPKSYVPRIKKRDGVRDVSTMTDPIRQRILPQPAPQARSFIAAGTPQTIQARDAQKALLYLNGNDPVFRVPLTPAFHSSALIREEQEKMRLQDQLTKTMLQQGGSKSRLARKRSLTPKNRKRPPIIVQRTLLPKASSSMITYIHAPVQPVQTAQHIQPVQTAQHIQPVQSVQPQAIQTGGPPQAIIKAEHAEDITSDANANRHFDVSTSKTIAINGSNILSIAAQVAQIDEITGESQDALGETGLIEADPGSGQLDTPTMVAVSSTFDSKSHFLLSSATPTKMISSLASQADITLSDLDISMSSVNASNMGPDAGDKFLDSVLQNSQQGFSGLINSSKKSPPHGSATGSSHLQSISVETDFDSSILRTPPHSGSSFSRPSSSLDFSSPMTLSTADQPWLSSNSGDISLSSILGESSCFHGNKPKLKTPSKSSDMITLSQSVFFDNSSSDAMDSQSLNKPSFASDVSLSCLLNDSNLGGPKNVESLNTITSDALSAPKESSTALFSEASQDSFAKLDVTFQGMVNESSMDFVSKLENLAAHITANQDHDSSSKLNTPIKKECDMDGNDLPRRGDGFVSMPMKNR